MLDPVHFETASREEVARANLARVRHELKARGIDALIVNRSDNLRFVTGVMPTDNIIFSHRQAAIVLRDAEQPVLFAASHYAQQAKGRFWVKDVRGLPRVQATWAGLFAAALREHGVGSSGVVALDPFAHFTVSRQLERGLGVAEIVDGLEMLEGLRAIKSPQEIAIIDAACALGEVGFAAAMANLREGIMEMELAAEMSRAQLAAGAEALYARRGSIVTSGERFANFQETPSRNLIRRREFVELDVGPAFKGYYCDFCRTAMIGDPTPDQKLIYRTAYTALQHAIAAVRPGVTATAVDKAARDVIRDAGLLTGAQPLIGHGVGLVAQEEPYLVAQEFMDAGAGARDLALQTGMVLALSSGVFRPGIGGCWHEETVAVVDGGCRVLSRAPYPGLERFM